MGLAALGVVLAAVVPSLRLRRARSAADADDELPSFISAQDKVVDTVVPGACLPLPRSLALMTEQWVRHGHVATCRPLPNW